MRGLVFMCFVANGMYCACLLASRKQHSPDLGVRVLLRLSAGGWCVLSLECIHKLIG